MNQSMEVVSVDSNTVVYVGHEVIEGIPLTAVVFARQQGEAGYLYHDPDGELHDGLLAAESAGSYINQVKANYEVGVDCLPMSTCYPQTLGNHGKIMLNLEDLSVDAIVEAMNTLTPEQVSELSDPTDAYFILPNDAGDDVVSGLREALGEQGIERGRVVRNRVMGDKAVWIANVDGLVLNFTVDNPKVEAQEPDEEPVVTAPPGAKEFAQKKAVKTKVTSGSRGKNLEKRWTMDDNTSKALLYALHMAVNSLAKEVGVPVMCHIPSDVPEEVSIILRKMDIPVYEGAKTPPRNAGVMFITEGEE